MLNTDQLWQAVLGELELTVSKAHFVTWLKNTFVLESDDKRIIVAVPHTFAKEWLETKFNKNISCIIQTLTGGIKEIRYIIQADQFKKQTIDSINKPQNTPSTGGTDINLNRNYTFNNFVVGTNNELAHAAAQAVVNDPGNAYNPLFIYGGVGLGKTHLLQAIGNEATKQDKTIKYVPSETFLSEMVLALKNHTIDGFKQHYRKVDFLIIDDIQFISGKEKTQDEFFHIFNALYSANKQIVLSSDRPPRAIATLEERLKSRFEGGMIADISFPDFETRLAIIKTKMEQKGRNFPDEVLNFLATSIQNNIRELEGALNSLIAHTLLYHKEITIEDAQNILKNTVNASPKQQPVTPKKIVLIVTNFFEINPKDLTAHSRKKELVMARQIAMYLMRKEINYSFPAIGEILGGRDHTTAIHAFGKIEEELPQNENLRRDIALIKERLYNQ